MIIISAHAPRMIPSEHLSRQRAGMNGIFDLSLVKNISLGKRFEFFDHEIMKLALIAIGLLATTGVVYAACVFSDTKRSGFGPSTNWGSQTRSPDREEDRGLCLRDDAAYC